MGNRKGSSSWTAVVLAAGKGTRMKSRLPKVLHPLLGKPLVGHVLSLLPPIGIGRTIVVIGHGSEMVEDYLSGKGVEWVIQEEQLGTGHAVLVTQSVMKDFEGTVLILCGDTPLLKAQTLKHFMAEHEKGGAALSILSSRLTDPTGYGRIVRDPENRERLIGIVEEKDSTPEQRSINEINTGIYAVDSRMLFQWLNEVGCENAQGEYYLTDIVGLAVKDGAKVMAMPLAGEEEALGVNSRAELSRAESILLQRIREGWMKEGVTFSIPESVYIEPTVRLARDVTIGPSVVLKGQTVVGEGAVIGAFSHLEDSRVPEGAKLSPYTRLP